MVKSLLYGSKARQMPVFARMYDDNRWEHLTDLFIDCCFKVQGITHQTLLETLVGSGLTALKTPFCEAGSNLGHSCPVCDAEIFSLARHLPYCTKASSTLICRILGTAMDEHNPPVVLPNNQVYSQRGVERISKPIAGSTDRSIVCPVTQAEFRSSQVVKIFLTS